MTYSSSSSWSLFRSKATNSSLVDQELSNGVFISARGRLQRNLGSRLTKLTVRYSLFWFDHFQQEREMSISRFLVFAWLHTQMKRPWCQSTKHLNFVDDTKQGKNFCRQRQLMKHHIDNGERQTAIQNEASGFLHLRLADLSLAMIDGAMALGRYWQNTVNKSYAWYYNRQTVDYKYNQLLR